MCRSRPNGDDDSDDENDDSDDDRNASDDYDESLVCATATRPVGK